MDDLKMSAYMFGEYKVSVQWAKTVACMAHRLRSDDFKTWLIAVGQGTDKERIVKSHYITEALHPSIIKAHLL